MTVWDDVRQVLLDLEDTGALVSYPNLTSREDRSPPISVRLAAWATDAAADLHRRFGDDVALVVGVLPYPMTKPPESATPACPLANLDWLTGTIVSEVDRRQEVARPIADRALRFKSLEIGGLARVSYVGGQSVW